MSRVAAAAGAWGIFVDCVDEVDVTERGTIVIGC